MSEARTYSALEITWPDRPTDFDRELLLAVVDDHAPSAVEDTPIGARVFFSSVQARDRAALTVASTLRVACTSIEVSDERWAERSQEALPPVTVGRLMVTTSEASPGLEPRSDLRGRLTIIIRPSMGFGTGHHASTRLCLALLQQTPLEGATVLDAGTGSGVLAIAAVKLGAAMVRAIDNDAEAIQSARENLELNGVERSVTLRLCDLAGLPDVPRADLVTANLTGAHLVSAAAALTAVASPDGRLILGGLQTDEEAGVHRAFDTFGWTLLARAEEQGWVGLLLDRQPQA